MKGRAIMARAYKHGAHIMISADQSRFRIIKLRHGRSDYAMESQFAVNTYDCAMDMARDNNNAVTISQEAADRMHAMACCVYGEFTIVTTEIALGY